MNPHQVRSSLAFARLPHVRHTVSDLVNGVYVQLLPGQPEPADQAGSASRAASVCKADVSNGDWDHAHGV